MSWIKSLLVLLLSSIVAIFLFEIIFRSFFIHHKNLYLESSNNRNPKHYLTNNWNGIDVKIVNGIRSHSHLIEEKTNKFRIALIGDSVAFGSSLQTKNTLAYMLEKNGNNLQIKNYGVPGYNIFDYRHIIKSIKKDDFDLIIYQLTKNDITLASTGYYSLLRNDDEVIVRFNEIDLNLINQIKVFLQRNLKSIYVIASYLKSRKSSNHMTTEASYKEEKTYKCHEDISQEYKNQMNIEDFLNAAYANTKYTNEMTKVILESQKYIENILKTKVILLPVWNFHEVSNFNNSSFKDFVISLNKQGMKTPNILFDSSLHKDFKECEYWADSGHPGPKYNRVLAKHLLPEIKSILISK